MNSSNIPDPNKAAAKGIQADFANFPFSYLINAAAQMGNKINVHGQTYDFTGLGNASVAGKISDQMAQAMLDIQKNTGTAFIEQRLKDLKQSDPTGYAARQHLFDRILADSKSHPDRPMAEDLQNQVNGMLKDAGQLDKKGMEEVQQGVRGKQVAKGIYLGNAPAAEEAKGVVNASDALRSQQQDQALNYLKSGASPDEVEYRRIQQSLANLGAFVNKQTPEAQFGSLSGASQGAAPFNVPNYSNPASLNPNAGAYGQQFAQQAYQLQQQQGNPFLQGAATGINAFNSFQNFNRTPQGMNPYSFSGVKPSYPGNYTTGTNTPQPVAPVNINTTPAGGF